MASFMSEISHSVREGEMKPGCLKRCLGRCASELSIQLSKALLDDLFRFACSAAGPRRTSCIYLPNSVAKARNFGSAPTRLRKSSVM
jgi:hypothetical protein